VLLHALRARLRAAPAAPSQSASAPDVVHAVGGTVASAGPCAVFTPTAPSAAGSGVEVQTRGPVTVEAATAPVTVGARVFADGFTPIGTVAPESDRAVHLPATDAGPWHVQLGSAGAIRVCSNR
jgi:hypothetical protein